MISLDPVDEVSILTVCDNRMDMLLLSGERAKRWSMNDSVRVVPAPSLVDGTTFDFPVAQHGFSALLTIRKADATHRFLFDTGVTPDGCVENLARLDVDPGDIEVLVCSHGHFDHATGISGLARRLGPTNLPVLIHPDFWLQRRIAIPGLEPVELPTTSRRALTDAGFDVIEERRPSFLFDGSVLVTGEVDRTTDFETGFAVHQARRNGRWEPDPLILDDQALILEVAGKGLVVLTGCGHAGIVNIVRYAQRLTGVDRVHFVMGGFHLSGPLFEPIIDTTVHHLAELSPDGVVPAHCTGFAAQRSLVEHLPDAFIEPSVGTKFELAGT